MISIIDVSTLATSNFFLSNFLACGARLSCYFRVHFSFESQNQQSKTKNNLASFCFRARFVVKPEGVNTKSLTKPVGGQLKSGGLANPEGVNPTNRALLCPPKNSHLAQIYLKKINELIYTGS